MQELRATLESMYQVQLEKSQLMVAVAFLHIFLPRESRIGREHLEDFGFNMDGCFFSFLLFKSEGVQNPSKLLFPN